MDLGLTFANGGISGEGSDDVGLFFISGRFDVSTLPTAECYWTKTYAGAHNVFYHGFREGKGIWGTWEISSDARGGFHIGPRANANGEEERVSAKHKIGLPAVPVHTPSLL